MSVQSASQAVLPRPWQPKPDAEPSRRSTWMADAVPVVAIVVALVGWFVPLGGIRLRDMSSIGLLSVIPGLSLAALGLLCVSFTLELRRSSPRTPILLVHVIALLVMVYALPAVVEPELRFAVTWRHVGIIDKIVHTGAIDPRIDAYFNWPGFFAGAALIERAAGLSTVINALKWAPLAFELLALAPLLLIMRTLSTGPRLRWTAVWVFYLANWVGQDYFSPQAFAYVLYLILLGAILAWLHGTNPWRPPWARRTGMRFVVGSRGQEGIRQATARVWPLRRQSRRVPVRARTQRAVPEAGQLDRAPSPAARTAIVAIVILIVAAVVASHQLTPFALLPGVTLLVILRRCSARALPLVIAMIIATWISYMAVAYLAGHAGRLLSNVGEVGSIVNQSVAGRVHGASGHLLVTTAQVVLAGGLWSLAVLGAWRRARRGYDDLSAIALGLGCFVLPLLQPYGGEIVLRVFLFSLPFTSFFVAALFITPPTGGRSPALTVALATLSLCLAGGLLLVRYGNERMDWFSPGEVAAVHSLYRAAPPHSTLVAWSSSVPWKYRDYADHHYRLITENRGWTRSADLAAGSPGQLAAISRVMRGQRHGAYLILTRSQEAQVDLLGLGQSGTVERVWRALAASPAFHVVYANPDGIVVTAIPRRKTK
jgi:hypothetical protein